MNSKKEANILLVEDDPADVELTREGMKDAKMFIHLHTVDDGIEALKFLRHEPPYGDRVRPDLILLDLNLPKKDGREVLKEIKNDEDLKAIPVVVLTTSDADTDIVKCYDLGANCYVTKPVNFDSFIKVVHAIDSFWFTIVKIPGMV
jgi:two-component system response regulator